MGMYSTFKRQDIKVKDVEGLREAVKPFKNDVGHLDLTDFNADDEDIVNFEAWDNSKLESYWCDNTVKILKAIAPYIEGWVEFHYEEGYNFRIVFKNGKVYRQYTKEPVWHEPVPLE